MVNSVQIIVTGFHRSGTSMAMQSLKKAGVHIGDSQLVANLSNPDGLFEDVEAVKLHDRWLAPTGAVPINHPRSQRRMQTLVLVPL